MATARGGMAADFLLITCEHGGNRIPAPYRYLFLRHQALLDSHRGYDAGALLVATQLATRLGARLLASSVSRLLIDLNRSVGHPHLYSEATRAASAEIREQILARYYQPYRSQAEDLVRAAVDRGKRVIHISSHSFAPELDGKVRVADIGLLYHPARPGEVDLCERWKALLQARVPELRVRRNYPYLGKNDGLTAHFRLRFPPESYIGIELEVNQKHVIGAARDWRVLRKAILASLRDAIPCRLDKTSL